ncbi:MAG: helix-turn-helix domain-containing protein [Candidatus Obscuribacterales bacterium]|nr:helix-turn-helix domain-containing protein [Candidatus Obscuribacterales bacterium]
MRKTTCEPFCSKEQASVVCRFPSELLSRKEAAVYLGVSEQTLAIWKTTGRYSLPVIKIGRLAKYKKADLDAFISRRVQGG